MIEPEVIAEQTKKGKRNYFEKPSCMCGGKPRA